MMSAKRNLALISGIILILIYVLPAAAQEATPSDDEVNAIAKQLYCPVCENIPLDVCPIAACVQWRETIRLKLADGWSAEEIKQFFIEQYGDRVLATPPAQGLNWLVYIIPPLALALGIYLLGRTMRSWSRAGKEPHVTSVDADDPYITRMEEELRKRK
jgi:cytochrome c-type biogenesis protein CcmH